MPSPASDPSSTSSPCAPARRVAGRYRLQERLARGGNAEIFEAHDEHASARVAIKRLLPQVRADQRAAQWLEREYHTLARLKHPNIVEVYEYGVDEDGPYYVMERVAGPTLREDAPLPHGDVCRLVRDIAASLAMLHARRTLHGDVSPANICLARDGTPKLIDFGTMCTFDVPERVVGTPPCMPPELLRGAPLDQRADLYSLGATAYWALTGRHAYPARSIDQLPHVWRTPPPDPSALVEDIPQPVDELVMSLLELNPMARPASAAHIIDRLVDIAALAPRDARETVESYVASSALIGRATETDRMQQRMRRAMGAHGGVVLLEAGTGLGKTRLLHEAALEAPLRGLAVARSDGQADVQTLGTMKSLAVRLLRSLPDDAKATRTHASHLMHLVPELRERYREAAPAILSDTIADQHAEFQHAMRDWIIDATRQHPVALFVDDVHEADDVSLSLLSSLASSAADHALLIVCTLNTDQAARAPRPLASLQRRATRLRLRPLSESHVEQLVVSMFGDGRYRKHLATWLHRRTGGVPFRCVALVRHLVQTGGLSYAGGRWVLPGRLEDADDPGGFENAMASRVARLGVDARGVADVLSVQRGEVSHSHLLAVWKPRSAASLHGGLDELLEADVILASTHGYRFTHSDYRDAVRSRLPPQRSAALHRRIAETLEQDIGDDPLRQLDTGWHWLHGGERTRGADMLCRAGTTLARRGDGLHAAVPALQAALEVYRSQRRSRWERAMLLASLTVAGYYVDPGLTLRYGKEALELLEGITGLRLARRLARWLGPRAALKLGIALAALVHTAYGRRRYLGRGFKTTFESLMGVVTASANLAAGCVDVDMSARILGALGPLRALPHDHVGRLGVDMCERLHLATLGREGESDRVSERLLEKLQGPTTIAGLREASRRALIGNTLFSLAAHAAFRDDDLALRYAHAHDRLDRGISSMLADQMRALYYHNHGTTRLAEHYRQRAESRNIAGSSAWQADMLLPRDMLPALRRMRDIMGLKRCFEELEAQAREFPALRIHARTARASYLLESGKPEEAAAILEAIGKEMPPCSRHGWQYVHATLADALDRCGRSARAVRVCERALAARPAHDELYALRYVPLRIRRALARARLGHRAEAEAELERLIVERRDDANPLTMFEIHLARARLALDNHDATHLAQHAASARRWAEPTLNSFLIAQCDQLEGEGERAGLLATRARAGRTTPVSSRGPTAHTVYNLLRRCPPGEQRAQVALQALISQSGARGGVLYVLRGGALEHAASSGDAPPRDQIEATLQELVETFDGENEDATDEPGVSTHAEEDQAQPDAGYHPLVLSTSRAGTVEVVGAVALRPVEGELVRPGYDLLERIASALREPETLSAASGTG